ncbi:MAG: hypothetical protein JWN99_1284 [Ilumatobacteraceae bacterium]|nr:hypothetical protein [Ilumatobacteraceae bacterium]
MNFDLGEQAEAFRVEVRNFIEKNVTPEMIERAWTTGTLHDWDLHRLMAERRWIAPSWPFELGGQGRSEAELVAFHQEFARAGVPIDGLSTTMLVVDTLRHVGTLDQQQRVVPAVLAGSMLLCLGYTEPGSGSDVAAARTRAVRDDDHWIIDGQKMFTTMAHESSYVFLLTRTDSSGPKHRGLTMFLVPMDAEGVEVSEIRTLGGQQTNVTFYNAVRVPDSARVGEVNGGWEVMKVALALERTVPMGPGPLVRRIEEWMRLPETSGHAASLDSESLRTELARTRILAEVVDVLYLNVAYVTSTGNVPSIEGSMAKLFGAEVYNQQASALLDVFGPIGLRSHGDPQGVAGGELEHSFRYATFCAIAGGASEIQRSIIAERHLGLPRSR